VQVISKTVTGYQLTRISSAKRWARRWHDGVAYVSRREAVMWARSLNRTEKGTGYRWILTKIAFLPPL
jgi:hypothetical protein